MKNKEQVVFDIGKEKFKYLQRDEIKSSNKVDMVELNKRLNETKRMNFYNIYCTYANKKKFTKSYNYFFG